MRGPDRSPHPPRQEAPPRGRAEEPGRGLFEAARLREGANPFTLTRVEARLRASLREQRGRGAGRRWLAPIVAGALVLSLGTLAAVAGTGGMRAPVQWLERALSGPSVDAAVGRQEPRRARPLGLDQGGRVPVAVEAPAPARDPGASAGLAEPAAAARFAPGWAAPGGDAGRVSPMAETKVSQPPRLGRAEPLSNGSAAARAGPLAPSPVATLRSAPASIDGRRLGRGGAGDATLAEANALVDALMRLRRGDASGALAAVEAYLARQPHGHLRAEAEVTRVDALLALGRRDEALAALDRLPVARLPRGHRLRVVRADLRARAGRCAESEADLRGVRMDAGDPLAALVQGASRRCGGQN